MMDNVDLHTKAEVIESLSHDLDGRLELLVTSLAVQHHKKEPADAAIYQELVDTYLQWKAVNHVSERNTQRLYRQVESFYRQSAEAWSTKEKIMAGLYIILILSILALFVNTYRFY